LLSSGLYMHPDLAVAGLEEPTYMIDQMGHCKICSREAAGLSIGLLAMVSKLFWT